MSEIVKSWKLGREEAHAVHLAKIHWKIPWGLGAIPEDAVVLFQSQTPNGGKKG